MGGCSLHPWLPQHAAAWPRLFAHRARPPSASQQSRTFMQAVAWQAALCLWGTALQCFHTSRQAHHSMHILNLWPGASLQCHVSEVCASIGVCCLQPGIPLHSSTPCRAMVCIGHGCLLVGFGSRTTVWTYSWPALPSAVMQIAVGERPHGPHFKAKMHEINHSTVMDPHRPPGGYQITIRHKWSDEVCVAVSVLASLSSLATPSQQHLAQPV